MERYLLTDNSPEKPYQPKNNYGVKMFLDHIKNGQRKLDIMETLFLKTYGYLSNTIVYAGASPGYHLNHLILRWPNHKFILYDPIKIKLSKNIRELRRVQTFTQPFNDDIAAYYKGKNVLFISDVRSFDQKEGPRIEVNRANRTIVNDMAMQKRWVELMSPTMSILKFRTPWYEGILEYFKGELFVQPWSGEFSPELRLITKGTEYRNYNHTKIDNQMYYHNVISRRNGFDAEYDDFVTTKI